VQLVEPRVGLRVLRTREIELCDGGLVARLGVVERLLRQQLRAKRLRDRSALVSASLQVASRCRIVALDTSCAASAA
jgi:hypothetical protein